MRYWKGEALVFKALKARGFWPIYRQYRHPWLPLLPYDFAFYDRSTSRFFILERDGEQHFRLGRYARTEKKLAKIQLHDAIKTRFVSELTSARLIRIPYTCKVDLHIDRALRTNERIYLASRYMYGYLDTISIPPSVYSHYCRRDADGEGQRKLLAARVSSANQELDLVEELPSWGL